MIVDDLAAAFDLATRAKAAHPYPVWHAPEET